MTNADWKFHHPFRCGQVAVAARDIRLGADRVLACGSEVVVRARGCGAEGNWISVRGYPGHCFQAGDFSARASDPAP